MNCKKCGASLPHGSYGKVKCEYCGTGNDVPNPEQAKEIKIEKEESAGKKWTTIAIAIIIIGIIGGVAAFVPLIEVQESYKTTDIQTKTVEYEDLTTTMVEETYTEYETRTKQVPRVETYTEYETIIKEVPREETSTIEVPTTVMKTVSKQVPVSEEKIVYVDEPYEEIESKSVSWTVDWYEIDTSGTYLSLLGSEEFPSSFSYYWGEGVVYSGYNNYVGFQATAKIKLASTKSVTFRIGSDDSSRLFLDGLEIIDNGGSHSHRNKETTVELTPGEHTLIYQYREYQVDASATFNSNGLVWEDTIIKYKQVPKTQMVTTMKTVTEEIAVQETKTVTETKIVYDKVEEQVPVTKTRTVYDTVEEQVPVSKVRLVPKEKTLTKTKEVLEEVEVSKTRTIKKTVLEYLLTEPLW